jgi:hypothetical protein
VGVSELPGAPEWHALSVPGSDDRIVLFEYPEGDGDSRNLVRMTSEGHVVWRAELPDPGSNDAYVEVRWRDGRLTANSWSCFLVELDPDTGQLLSATFTK